MFKIQAKNVSKRYHKQWLFQDLNLEIGEGERFAVLGPNGSGKSTLLKVLSGFVSPTRGEIKWSDEQELPIELWHSYFSYCAPYTELIEEFTLNEQIDFHFKLKTWRKELNLNTVLNLSGLTAHQNKQIKNFSSGMKQRLKLILSLGSDVKVYFLDEPTVNLDDSGAELYLSLVDGLKKQSTVIVGSNDSREYNFCNKQLDIKELTIN